MITSETNGILSLLAKAHGETSVVTKKPAYRVSFEVTCHGQSQRNIGLAIGQDKDARSHFCLVAEKGNVLHLNTSDGVWHAKASGAVALGDVLSLNYDGSNVSFAKNG